MDYQPVPLYATLTVRRLYSFYHNTFDSNYHFPGERHDFWELAYVMQGRAGCTSGDNIYLMEPGDAVLQRPNIFHTMWTGSTESCEWFMISFDGIGLDGKLAGGKYHFDADEQHSIQTILQEVPGVFRGCDLNDLAPLEDISPPGSEGISIVKSHLELLCLSLARRGKAAQGNPSNDKMARCYARVTAFLRENVEQGLSLDDICRGVYESVGTVKSVFHRFTGGGVMKYYNQLRCERIMELLTAGMTVQDAAARMNFSSPYYLSYFFKRETGMTPRDYSKRERRGRS